MIDRKSQLIRKFCEEGNLHDYKEVIEHLIDRIQSSNCLIADCDTCEKSYIEEPSEIGKKNLIMISFKYEKEKPVHLIWDILHEFGHHLSGHPNGQEKSIEREKLAWEYGRNVLNDYLKLMKEEQDFEEYKDICLESYSKYHSNNKKPTGTS